MIGQQPSSPPPISSRPKPQRASLKGTRGAFVEAHASVLLTLHSGDQWNLGRSPQTRLYPLAAPEC
jgi:hypothetical protein